jgi:hypothetical protein
MRYEASRSRVIVLLVALVASTACGGQVKEQEAAAALAASARESARKLSDARLFFAHQSVGGNIMDGVKALLESAPSGSIKLMSLAAVPQAGAGGFFVHERLGTNGDPEGKTDAFVSTLEGGLGNRLDVALQKYCFADFTPTTDSQRVFDYYRQAVDRVHRDFPGLTLVHVTAPLMAVQSGPRAVVKKLIGQAPDYYEDNIVRERFNDLMRQTYGGREPLFDLARLESTREGSETRESTSFKGQTVFALLPQYTTDGGHLTPEVEQRIAAEFLNFLAGVAAKRTSATER